MPTILPFERCLINGCRQNTEAQVFTFLAVFPLSDERDQLSAAGTLELLLR